MEIDSEDHCNESEVDIGEQNEQNNRTRYFCGNNKVIISDDPIGDGSCQFGAIVPQIRKLGIHETPEHLRTIAVQHLESNSDHYRNFLCDDRNFESYVEEMRRPYAYGDNLTLQALAREFNCQFLVLNSLGGTYHRIVSNMSTFNSSLPLLTLGNYPEDRGDHYVSVEVETTYLQSIIAQIVSMESCIQPNVGSATQLDVVSTTDIHPIDVTDTPPVNADNMSGAFATGVTSINNILQPDVTNTNANDALPQDDVNATDELLHGNDDNATDELLHGNDDNATDELLHGNDDNATDELLHGNGDNATDELLHGNDDSAADELLHGNNDNATDELLHGNDDNAADALPSDVANITDTLVHDAVVSHLGSNAVSLPYLPDMILENIVRVSIEMFPLTRYRLQYVRRRFREIVLSIGFPIIHLSPNIMPIVPWVVSVRRLRRTFGSHSGVLIEVKQVLSGSERRWDFAWLRLRETANNWFEIRNIGWRR
ncbi:hypothetical protein KUTeg_014592 [Tegillarca granosa]|uniref:OTU domain-containing protein n=1 Tax=Tegillarca granosa TaxID=220873 RepID=A0ABQ9ES51_TEGGR|nr:hypothetical protein KUTeg_014592 [Tegillarca granosa]